MTPTELTAARGELPERADDRHQRQPGLVAGVDLRWATAAPLEPVALTAAERRAVRTAWTSSTASAMAASSSTSPSRVSTMSVAPKPCAHASLRGSVSTAITCRAPA